MTKLWDKIKHKVMQNSQLSTLHYQLLEARHKGGINN